MFCDICEKQTQTRCYFETQQKQHWSKNDKLRTLAKRTSPRLELGGQRTKHGRFVLFECVQIDTENHLPAAEFTLTVGGDVRICA